VTQPVVTKEQVTYKNGFSLSTFFNKYGTLLVIVGIIFFFSITNDRFFTYSNFTDILRSISIVTFVALGVTCSLIVGGFDLSVGSIVSMSTITSAAMLVWYRQELLVALVVPILVGLLIGLFNSFVVIRLRIPDLLGTLAVMYIINGVHLTATKGYSIYNNMMLTNGEMAPGKFIPSFLFIGQGKWLSIPFPVLLMLAAVIFLHLFFRYTKTGRLLYVTGGNPEAARLSGISVNRYRTYAYLLSAFFASVAGIVLAARVGTGQVSAGASLLMDAVAASFIGYSVFGQGKPNVIGTFFGAVLIGVLLNGLTMWNVPYYAMDILKGSILVLALAIMYVQKKGVFHK
jgi:simple sugar transport system permease protein